MLEERGQVVEVGQGVVRVRVERKSACSGCQARAACGSGLMQGMRPERCHEVRALTDLELHEGDFVVLGVSEELILHSALLVYVLPLVLLLAGALAGQQLGLSEGWSILLAIAGFVASFVGLHVFNRRHAADRSLVPVVLRPETGA